jgi:hypothetical protein
MNCADLRTRLLAMLLIIGMLIGSPTAPAHAAVPTGGTICHGRFANPITDICWSCLFPLTIGGIGIVSDGQPDIGNPSSPVCYCNNPPRLGISIGFWEPVRMVDVTRTPFCMVGLGGLSLDPGIGAPRGAQVGHDSQTRNSFYQVHWYANPILAWLEVLLDFPCLEQGSLDLAYLTEVDPLWSDDELSAILNPEAVLFANPVAKGRLRGRLRRGECGLSGGQPLLVRRLPGLDLPDDRPRHHPHRRRAGLGAADPAHDRQDAPAAHHLRHGWLAGPVRPVPAAPLRQDPLQAADDLPGARHREGRRPVLPALRAHHHDLGLGQVLPGQRGRLQLPDLPQEELLCRRLVIRGRSGAKSRPSGRPHASPRWV